MEQANNAGSKKIVFSIEGKRPDQAEAERLSALHFGSDMRGSAEVSHALKNFFGLLVAAVAMFFIGGWVISGFKGLGVLFFGYGFMYIGAPGAAVAALSFLFSLFRTAHKKKAEEALKWAWKVSAMGDDASSHRFGDMEYAYSTMSRMIPQGAASNISAYAAYVTSLRAAMSKICDEASEPLRAVGWKETFPIVRCDVVGDTEILPNVHELKAVLQFTDRVRISYDNKSRDAAICQIELHIKQCYVHCEKYWFPYDITPAFREETGDAERAEAA